MSSFNQEFNRDNSAIRYTIVALLYELKDRLKYPQTRDQETVMLGVPFYYSLTGMERFLLDQYLNDETQDPYNEKPIGSYDVVPRCVISLSSLNIDSGSLVNKFVRMEKLEKEGNELKPYSYETMLVPIIMEFSAILKTNSNIEMFKITESLIKTFYKNNIFYVDMGGYRISANVSFPEDYGQEKLMEFTFSDKKTYDIEFPLTVNSYIAVFNETSKRFAGNVMDNIMLSIDDTAKSPVSTAHSNDGYNAILSEEDGVYPRGPRYGNTDVAGNPEDR